MTGDASGQSPRPVVRTFVGKRPGRYRARWEASEESMPEVRDGGVVRVSVGAGLRPADMAAAVAFATSVRNARVVQILGDSRWAVDHARQVFLAVWAVDLPESGPTPAADVAVSRWARLMLAQTRDGGKGSAR